MQLIKSFFNVIIVYFSIVYSIPSFALEPLIINPQPFRGDEIEGRDFNFNNDAFLHRVSFTPYYEWSQHWRSGYIGSIGSISSDEFYSLMNLQKQLSLSKHLIVEIRAERGEDFDSRFERNQLGLGYRFNNNWSLIAFSDLKADKENEDIQLELRFDGSKNNFFRAAVIATDIPFNDKQDVRRYIDQPYTYFIETNWRLMKDTLIHGAVNYNAPLSLDMPDRTQVFEYENISAQLNLYHQLSANKKLHGKIYHERGNRKLISLDNSAEFDRDYLSASIELNIDPQQNYAYWIGVKALQFEENDIRYLDINNSSDLKRDEIILYGGIHFVLNSEIIFSPAIFVDEADISHLFESAISQNKNVNKTLAKLNLPFMFNLDNDARVLLNTTFELDSKQFGGLNLQLDIPF